MSFKSISKAALILIAVLGIVAPAVAAEKNVKVDLNRATVEQLRDLPRVGPALAERIVKFRKENGGFHKAEDLMLVKGIGQKTFDFLRESITVSEAPAPVQK